jgi:two-component system chemotaxis sensor kinase CheA
MINSLDQGFFLVNEKQKILGEFSNSAKLFFGPDLEGKSIDNVIKGEGVEPQFLKTFFDNLFLETIPFESLLDLAPKQFNTNDHRTIVLDYEPIRNSSEKIVVVVVISTDITEKLKIEKENERQRNHVKMILKILNGQYQFTRLLQETKASFDEFLKHEDDNLTHEHLLRLAHSLKGNFGIYYIIDLVHLIHEIEKKIILAKDPLELMECFHTLVSTVDSELSALALEYPFLTNGSDWKQTNTYFTYEESQIKDVIESISKARNIAEVKEILNYQLLKLPIKTLFASLIDDCIEHADRVGKPMLQLDLFGGDLRVDPTFCSILVQHLIHLTRNSVDHGLEFPSERLTLGKKENGCISISVSKTNEQHVVISIKDDGRGINVERLIEKAKEAGIDMSRFNEENAWELIFEPGLSTASEESLTSGRGIGMFDVQKFIRDSRGEIKVSTQKGVGTEFIITLPTF